MAQPVQARIAPFIKENFQITGTQYHYRSGGAHGGLDIATYSSSLHELFSMVTGTVLFAGHESSYGNYIIIQDDTTGDTFLYAHMQSYIVYKDQKINQGDFVGIEGRTGNVTGRHVHLELQYHTPGESWTWGVPYDERPNVAEYMGLTNTQGLVGYYDGIPGPVPPGPGPSPTTSKSKYPWFIETRKRRNRNKQ